MRNIEVMKSGSGKRNLLLAATLISLSTTMQMNVPVQAETLAEAIANATTPSYTLTDNYTFTDNAGALAGADRTFTIDGQNLYSIYGAEFAGITVVSGQSLTINNVKDFNNFKITDSNNALGGAIYNNGGTIEITGSKFSGNTVKTTSNYNSTAQGGAIYNSGTVTQIVADFINNKVEQTSQSVMYAYKISGGAIYNYDSSIGTITGTFEGNSALNDKAMQGSGGAIFNFTDYNTATISNLNADFNSNTAYNGGAIANYGDSSSDSATITSISGKTDGDKAQFTGNTAYKNGGAIYNYSGTINTLNADFTGNKVEGRATTIVSAYGGAIYNQALKNISQISNITGKFDRNYVSSISGTDTSYGYDAYAYGGAIYNYGSSNNNNNNAYLSDISGSFENNYAYARTKNGSAKQATARGGAIYNGNYGVIDALSVDFTGNYAKAETPTSAITNAEGGAVYNAANGTIGTISGATFGGSEEGKGNYAISTLANDGHAYGGAIYNAGTIGDIDNDVFSISDSLFEGNYVSSPVAAYGGAIYTTETLYIKNTDFKNNKALVEYDRNSQGGAIYGDVTIYTAKNSDNSDHDIVFSGNIAEHGAAICGGTISLVAENGNITFENNNRTGNALTESDGTTGIYAGSHLFLVTDNNHTITINDDISAYNLVAEAYKGDIILNGKIVDDNQISSIMFGVPEDNPMTGKLVLAGKTSATNPTILSRLDMQQNGTLSLQNDYAGDVVAVSSFGGSGELKLNIDYDATANTMDKINVDNVYNGGYDTEVEAGNNPKLTLNAINVLNDNSSFVDGTTTEYLTGDARANVDVISSSINSALDNGYMYVFSPTSTHGELTVLRKIAYGGDLINAIQDDLGGTYHPTSFSLSDNFTADRNFGALNTENRSEFTIFGNSKTISGDNNTYTGIVVGSDQILNLDNVRFSNVKTYDVQNAGTLNLSGDNTINTITGATGTTNINSGATTFTNSIAQNEIAMKGGRIVVNSGADITADVKGYEGTPYTSENGTRAIYNNGGTISNITGTFKGNSAAQSTTSNVKGGVLYTQNGTVAIDSATFDGNSVKGSSGGSGGAIYSNGTNLTITGTTENPTVFKNNGISKYDNNYQGSAYGGAIYQTGGTLNISNAKFENNVSDFNIKSNLYGGAIYTEATGGNISADFTGNTLSAVAGSGNGGAIYNEGTLTKITGDFTNNAITLQPTSSSEQYGGSSGGAIANRGTITNGIDGTFSGNTITTNVKQSDANGGAIANGGTIGNITGDFLNNYVTSTNTTYSGSARGGAIYNLLGTIGNITATNATENGFKGNSATKAAGYNAEGLGGAIYNYNGTIGNITANFVNNTATNYGGAIYNIAEDNYKSEIGNIIGNFTGNTAYQGSAIYNKVKNNESYINNKLAKIGDITGNFTENAGTVIYNDGYYDFNNFNETVYAQIGDITGNFSENVASSGNVIFNNYGKIGDITGDFTENTTDNGVINNRGSIDSITANTTAQKGFYKNTGGAIRNYASESYHREATIGNITADFKENVAQANGGGAAINNSSENANLKAKIGDITGDFDKNTSKNYGGAIYNNYSIIGAQNNLGEFTGTAITGDFTYNQVDNNSVYNSIGGAIANENSSAIGNIQGNFENNSIIDSRYKAMGGAIANRTSSTIGNITGNFNANSISYNPIFDTDTFEAQHYGNSSLGGAIYNDSTSTIGTLTGDFVGNRAKGHVAEDDTTTVFAAAGGAIYNEGALGTITGDIKNNYALGHSHHGVYGGAIYTTTGLNLVDSDITGNYVTTQSASATDLKGGAIYTTDGINITASTKNISVSGNKGTEQGAAIYNTSSDKAVVLNATGGNITFENNNLTGLSDGTGVGIYSLGGLTLNAADGKYISLNDALNITGNTTLNGTLKLGDNAVETLANTTSKFIAQGGTLDIANGAVDTMTFANAVDIQNAINLGLDVNLTGTTATADKITADFTTGNTSAITLSALNFINDNYTGSEEEHELTIASGTIKSLINENITSTTGNTNTYTYSYNQGTGILTVSLVTYDNIYDAVHDTEKATRTYKIKLAEGETITQALGALAGTKLTVNGNNKYLDGDSKGGITVANGQTLELKNISQVKNFTTAVDNAGILNVEGVTFTDNTTDINNTATLNLSGNNTIKTITDAATPTGTTNITGGTTTIATNGSVTQDAINLQGGNLNVNAGSIINSDIFVDETIDTTGRLSVINSTINGTIHGTFKGNTDGVNSTLFFMSNTLADNDLTLDSVNFESNSAIFNGGLFYQGSGDLTLNNNQFINNTSNQYGAMFTQTSGITSVTGATFKGNASIATSGNVYGGAISKFGSGTLTISDTIFGGTEEGQGNSSTSTGGSAYGGAIYQNGGTLTITDSTFSNNSASATGTNKYGHGGAIYQTGGTLSVTDSKFINNSATGVLYGNGGAIYLENGTANYSITGTKTGSGLDATSTTEFIGNQASYGGALNIYNTSGTIDGVVFKGNGTNSEFGSAILYNYGTHTIDNSIFIAHNSTKSQASVIRNADTTESLSIDNSKFINNASRYTIHSQSALTIQNSEFSGNGIADDEYSSVINVQPSSSAINIYDTNIKNNYGNAIGFSDASSGTTNTLNIIANEVGGGVEISGNSGYGIYVSPKVTTETASEILLYANNGNILINNNTKGGIANDIGLSTLPSLTLNADTDHNITINDSITYKSNTSKGSLSINSNGNAGTVALNGALTLGGDTNIKGGTLKLGTNAAGSTFKTVAFTNTPTLDLQNTTADTMVVDKITGDATLNIDVNSATSVSDAIQIATTGSSGTLTVNSLSFLDDVTTPESFNINVITGAEGDISGITLAISSALAEEYSGTPVATDYDKPYTYNSNITFDTTKFTTEKWTKTTQKQLTLTSSETAKGLKLNVDVISDVHKQDGEGHYIYDTNYDALQVLNQHEGERTLTADGAGVNTYQVGSDLGTTATGTLNVTGKSGGSNLDMNSKTGFVVSNADTTLNLTNLNITNINDTQDGGLINLTGAGSKANLENVTIASTTNSAISNAVELNLNGTNNLGTGITGTGTTNINGGKTTIGSITQNAVNIIAGELEVADITAAINNGGILTLKGNNGNTINNYTDSESVVHAGSTVIAESLTNTGAINQAITVNGSKTLTTAANLIGGTVTNGGKVELTGGALGQTITGGDITIASGEVTSTVANLGGDITNDATLNLSGTLDKNIAGDSGVTKLNDNMTFADGASIAGTLNFNSKVITMSGDNATTTFNVGKITSDGTINIDVNTSGTPVSDVINITTAGSTGTITINSINEIGSRGSDFTLNILQGNVGDLQLALSDAVHSQFDQAQQHNIYYVSDAYQANIDFDKTSFNTAEWDKVTQKAISIEDNTKIKYATSVISDTATGVVTQKDALAFINQNTDTSAVANRSMVTSDTDKTYTVQEDLGTTGAGTLLVQGASDDTTKLDMNNKTGFVVANSGTTVTLKDINVDNVQNSDGALVNITNTGSSATLDGVTVNVKDNPENKANVISSNGTLGVTNSTVNAGVNNNGTMNLNGTNQIASVEGSNGSANVQTGTTTVGSIFQKLINIVTGGKLASNGDVTATNGITNNSANGLSVANGTLTGNVTGSGTTDFKGTSAIADGSKVGQAITVVDGKLTTLADGLGGAVTNGGEVDLTGGTLETSITGGNTTISGNVGVDDTAGSIASAVSVATGAKLTTKADKVTGAINNGGNLDLTGGDIKNTISGDGNTTISGTVTNTTGSAIGNAVTVAATGDLTTAADKLGGAVANGGTVQLDGGTLGQTITGGNISIIDDVDTNASNLAGATTVASSKELTLTGGDVNSNISGAGDTKITGSVNNNANISTATEVAGGALDNTNGQLANVTVTSGSLKSNADNVGAVENYGTYEITGGTIASGNGILGTGNINITGNVINNATNTTTGDVTVAAGKELAIGTNNDVFSSANSVTMGNGSTLNLQNGSAVATNINNVVVGADDTVNIALDWGDQINTTNPSNIAGDLQVSSVDLTGTDGSKQTYQITTTDGIKDKISIKDPLDIQGTGVSNFVKYNDRPTSANYGQLTTYQNSLFMAVTDTEVGEIATYNMITDETAGGGELDGSLKVQGNGHSITTGGIVIGSTTIQNAELTLEDTNLKNITGDAITVYGGSKGHIVANTQDVAITANTGNAIKLIANGTNYAEMDIDAGSKTVTIDNDIVSDDSHNKVTFKGGNVQFNGKFDPAMGVVDGSTVTRNGQDDGIDWTLTNGTLYYTNDTYLNKNTNSVIFNGGNLDTRNGVVTTFNLANMTLNAGTSNFYADVDLANQTMDNFGSTPVVDNGGKLNVAGLNLISDAANVNTTINFTTDPVLMAATSYTGGQGLTALSPIYKYNVGYDNTTGNFDFTRYNSGGYDGLNPAIMAAPVAAQLGGYLTQLNSYDEAFRNMDMYMLMTAQQRQALKNKNKIASLDGGVLYDATLMRQERAEGWFRPFATFEKVPLKNGPKVENIAYGTYMGGESQMYDLGHGWDGIWGAYVGYNGSHQNYDGVSIYQNGGTLGVLGMAYKGNFFTGLTINAGASGVEASTMYGNEDFAMLMAGIASKTGYNWELFNGKFIIQPSMLMSYSFVNTFDYKNAAGVNVDSDPLHAIQLQPEIKFIGNLKNGWQPYASVAMVWNIMDDTKFKANDVSLPELSVKPYVKYGVGVRKTWGERLTGFFQTYLTNGGRNGVGLQAGFTWAFGGGKDKKADEKKIQKSLNKTPELKKTEIVLNGKKVQ